ncbi:MAG: hypothetical protein NTY19_10340 [Planctomycetota bacterium]|nr:hypothetical protein [Planctomycetota bacterium]
MITLTRHLARQVRAVFRHALGTSPRGRCPAVLFRADQQGLTIRSKSGMAAIERSVPGDCPADEILVPGELLADCEGRSDQVVSIERQADGDLIATWHDASVPVVMRYTPPDAAELADFPAPPESMTDNPASLLTALRDASETAEAASIRFALDHLEMCGDSGTICATDSRQVLVQTGFRFPWQGKVLVPRSTLYGHKDIQPTAIAIGKTEEWLAVRIGPWLYHVKLGKDLRFPKVADHLQSPTGAVARLQVAPADAQFLDQSLPRLPGNDDAYRAITLDMNGQIAIRVRGDDQPQPTELLLSQSERIGDPLRISTDRRYLARALRLGFRELLFYAANAPVQCSDEARHYLWAVLEPDSAIKPSAKAITVAAPGGEPSTTGVARTKNRRRPDRSQGGATAPGKMDTELKPPADSLRKEPPMSENSTDRKTTTAAAEQSVRGKDREQPEAATNGDLASLVEGARTALREADAKLRTLSTALKQHQRQFKLVRSTLSSLQQLQGLDAA